jgi:GNAT superfamily N-acetyltransferase
MSAVSSLAPKSRNAPEVRVVSSDDVDTVVALNHAAYPDLVGANIVLTESQVRAHLSVFPRGQRIAVIDGVAAGGVSTFIVPREDDPLRPHTWLGITDEGYFRSHDPNGDTLYLADIFVDPAAWGRGVGASLYAALRDICAEHGLRRIVGGGRLYSYQERAHTMSPSAYVEEVVAGRLRDRVLDSQLKAGYRVRGILTDYLADPRSKNFATLIEWTRPIDLSRKR